jgi:hypothetical protein
MTGHPTQAKEDRAVVSIDDITALEAGLESVLAEQQRRRDPRLTPTRRGLAPALPEGPVKEGFDLGLVDEAQRQKTRAWVESLPPVMGFLVEAFPATFGTLAGFVVGGGILSLATATAGGITGELIAQETGIASRDAKGVAIAALGPAGGRLVGGIAKIGRKGAASFTKGLIPARVALARRAMREAAGEFESKATQIIANQAGNMKISAKILYDIVEKAGVRIPIFRLSSTRAAFEPLRKELSGMRAISEVRQAQRLIDDVEKVLSGSSVSFAELMSAKEMIGTAIGLVVKKTGKAKGAKKQFFKAVMEDIDHLASLGGKTGNVGKLAVAAGRRAKLDFAVKTFSSNVDDFLEQVAGKETLKLNIKGFRQRLRQLTSPDSKRYDKRMTEALKDELPAIQQRLTELSIFLETSPGGPGSLIVRGVFARAGSAVIGGAIGMGTGVGVIGGAVGAMVGVRAPEAITAILSSGPAVELLKKMVVIGQGAITKEMWDILGQVAAQGIKVKSGSRRKLDAQRNRPPTSPPFSSVVPQ